MIAQKLMRYRIGAKVSRFDYLHATDSTRVSVPPRRGKGFHQPTDGLLLAEKAIHYRSKKDARTTRGHSSPMSRARLTRSKLLSSDELRLYRLIAALGCFANTPAILTETIDIGAGKLIFRATGSVQKFDGFLRVSGRSRRKTEEDEEAERSLPLVEKGETLALNKISPEQHFTDPPPRFTEATLVKALEEKGIGRPSTYAAIMTTILAREYVEKREGRFHPTDLGKTVNDLLIEGGFGDLFNETYTARMEEELDSVEEGKLKWTDALHEFYDKFSSDLVKFTKYTKDIKAPRNYREICLNVKRKGWC